MSDAGILSAVFVAVIFAFYLMFLRPVQKDQARHRQQIRDLRPGDEVLTTSGFIGRVKDMGSAAVGLTLLLAGAVWLLALWDRVSPLF